MIVGIDADSAILGSPLRSKQAAWTPGPVVLFAFLWALAMGAYPGWNAFDAESVGHDFCRNFLCDLLSPATPDRRVNTLGSVAMNMGVVILVSGGLWPLWWQHAPAGEPWRTLTRVLGSCAALLTLTICVEQVFDLGMHNLLTLTAGGAGLIPTIVVAASEWRSSVTTTGRRLLIGGVFVFAVTNLVSYALVQSGGTLTIVVPLAQKAALVCLLLWLWLRARPQKPVPLTPSGS